MDAGFMNPERRSWGEQFSYGLKHSWFWKLWVALMPVGFIVHWIIDDYPIVFGERLRDQYAMTFWGWYLIGMAALFLVGAKSPVPGHRIAARSTFGKGVVGACILGAIAFGAYHIKSAYDVGPERVTYLGDMSFLPFGPQREAANFTPLSCYRVMPYKSCASGLQYTDRDYLKIEGASDAWVLRESCRFQGIDPADTQSPFAELLDGRSEPAMEDCTLLLQCVQSHRGELLEVSVLRPFEFSYASRLRSPSFYAKHSNKECTFSGPITQELRTSDERD
jgi:hypothetical protein